MNKTAVNLWLDITLFLAMVGLAITGVLMVWVLPPGTGHHAVLFELNRHDYGTIHFYLAFATVTLLAAHVVFHWSWICCVLYKRFGSSPPSPTVRAWVGCLVTATLLLLGAGTWWSSGQVKPTTIAASTQKSPSVASDLIEEGDPTTSKLEPALLATGEGRPNWSSQSPSSVLKQRPRHQHQRHQHQRHQHQRHQHQRHQHQRHRRHSQTATCPTSRAISGRTTLGEASSVARTGVEELARQLGIPDTVDSSARLGHLRRQYGFSMQQVREVACR